MTTTQKQVKVFDGGYSATMQAGATGYVESNNGLGVISKIAISATDATISAINGSASAVMEADATPTLELNQGGGGGFLRLQAAASCSLNLNANGDGTDPKVQLNGNTGDAAIIARYDSTHLVTITGTTGASSSVVVRGGDFISSLFGDRLKIDDMKYWP